jgi:tripartite-type tricarboxylate transporter receptor subunit TctC
MRRRTALAALLATPAIASAQNATGASWRPDRPIRIVVPFPPGGSNDVIARPLAEKLQLRLGQPVVIENRPGAGGAIGAAQVAQAAPDGHTLMVTSSSFAASAVIQRTPYDAEQSFEPISRLATAPFVVLTNPSFPPRDIQALIAYARANPGRVDYGSSGPGGINHFVTEFFALRAGIRLNHIPYRGMPPAVTDLVAGHIQVLITTVASASGPMRENRVRTIAATAPNGPPGVPVIRDVTGLDYDAEIWWTLFAPRGLPPEVSRTLNAAVAASLAEPDVARIYEGEGARPAPSSPAEFAQKMRAEITRFREVAQAANIRPE